MRYETTLKNLKFLRYITHAVVAIHLRFTDEDLFAQLCECPLPTVKATCELCVARAFPRSFTLPTMAWWLLQQRSVRPKYMDRKSRISTCKHAGIDQGLLYRPDGPKPKC